MSIDPQTKKTFKSITEKYKYGFTTDIESDKAPKGLKDVTDETFETFLYTIYYIYIYYYRSYIYIYIYIYYTLLSYNL